MLAILRPFTLGEEIFVTGGQGFRGSGTPSVSGAFYTLVPVRPRRRGERRSLRALPVASLRPPPAFNPRPRRLSTPTDACQLHPDIALYGTTLRLPRERDRVVPDDAHRERHQADLRAERCAANPEPFLFSPTYKTLDRNLNRRVLSRRQRHQRDADDRPRVDHRVSRAVLGPPPRDPGDPGRDGEVPSIAPEDKRPASPRAREPDRVRSIHWFPYDRVGVVNADP